LVVLRSGHARQYIRGQDEGSSEEGVARVTEKKEGDQNFPFRRALLRRSDMMGHSETKKKKKKKTKNKNKKKNKKKAKNHTKRKKKTRKKKKKERRGKRRGKTNTKQTPTTCVALHVYLAGVPTNLLFSTKRGTNELGGATD